MAPRRDLSSSGGSRGECECEWKKILEELITLPHFLFLIFDHKNRFFFFSLQAQRSLISPRYTTMGFSSSILLLYTKHFILFPFFWLINEKINSQNTLIFGSKLLIQPVTRAQRMKILNCPGEKELNVIQCVNDSCNVSGATKGFEPWSLNGKSKKFILITNLQQHLFP